MKKIFSIFMAFMLVVFTMNAQTVENSRGFENTFVTVYGGAITTAHTGDVPFFWDGLGNVVDGVRPLAGVEVGKYVTPVVGFSLEGLAMFNTLGTTTVVDQTNLVGNLKLNLSNWIGGYPGQPRRVEVVFVPGLGWGHDYGFNGTHGVGLRQIDEVDDEPVFDRNYFTYNIGVELNVNLGKARAWQVNVKPVVVWNNYESANVPRLENMQGRLQVGATYKFGSRRTNSHNFVLCPYTVTASDYASAKALISELQSNPVVKEVVVEKIVRDTVVVEKVVEEDIPVMVMFELDKAKLYADELIQLDGYLSGLDADAKIVVTGSADTMTGRKAYNERLAEKRANVVKDYIVKKGFKNVTTRVVLDLSENRSGSRVVVVE